MKKLIFTTILTLLGVMALTSCVERVKKGDRLTTMLTIESSQDLLDVCDIEVTYMGKGGVNMIDTITKTQWHKIIVNDSFPAKIGVVVLRYLIKPGFKPSKDTYDLQCIYTMTTKEMERNIASAYLRQFDVPAGKVVSFLDFYNYRNDSYFDEVITVFKAEGDLGPEYDPFIFSDMKPVNTLPEEVPVESPDQVMDDAETTDNN